MARTLPLLLALLVTTPFLAGCAADDPGTGATTTTRQPPAGPAPTADYGDAPDGTATGYPAPFAQTGSFPSRFASDGARALDVTQARIGEAATTEPDAQLPDADDGLVQMVMLLTQIPPPATLTVRAGAPEGSAGGTFHLNVLLDLDLDGGWGGEAAGAPEWVVRNQEVTLAAGESVDVETEPFAFANGLLLPDGAWMRVALTKERVSSADWDGSGAFAAGEVEDHVVTIPEVQGKLPAIPVMTCPETVDMTDKTTVAVTCTVANIAPAGHGQDISWRLSKLSGGVAIDVTEGTVVVAPGASVPVSFTATKGQPLPSRWAYHAVGIDPPSRVTSAGVEVGYGESEGETTFEETAKACALLVAEIETSREHRAGESDAIFWVFVKDHFDQVIEDAMVTAHVEAPGNPQVTGTTDAEGRAELRHTVHQYGEYALVVDDVEKDGCTFDREASRTTATASVQPG